MKKRLLLILTTFILGLSSIVAHPKDVNRQCGNSPSWLQYGFKIGANLGITSQYSETDKLKKLISAEFGAYARFGKHVYGEIGFGYTFHKGTYECPEMPAIESSERVESRFLQIPVKAVGHIVLGKKIALQPNLGILYQPLIQVTKNEINYNKNTISRHQLLWTAGLGVKIHFVTVDLAYKKNFTPFFSQKKSAKPDYFNIQLGFQL